MATAIGAVVRSLSEVLGWHARRNGSPVRNLGREIYLLMDLSTTCDILCSHCFRNAYTPAPRTMTARELEVLETSVFPHVDRLAFSETAEALHVRMMPEALSAARRAGIPFIRIQSNGTHLSPEVGKVLLDHDLNVLGVSLDAVTPETFARIRKGADWEQVVKNVRAFARMRDARPEARTRIALNFSVMVQNAAEAPSFIRFAKELGADSVSFTHLMIETEEMRSWSLIHDPVRANSLFSELREEAEQVAFPVLVPEDVPSTLKPFDGALLESPCYHGPCQAAREKWVYLMADGTCHPCLNLQDCRPMGNVFMTPLSELWFGPRNQSFRSGALDSGHVEGCDHCKIFIDPSETGNEMAYMAKRLTTRSAANL